LTTVTALHEVLSGDDGEMRGLIHLYRPQSAPARPEAWLTLRGFSARAVKSLAKAEIVRLYGEVYETRPYFGLIATPPRALVVIVDPDKLVADMYALGLSQRGFRVLRHETGAAFLAWIRGERPDLLVIEWELSDLSCEAILIAMRKIHRAILIPVVVLTAYKHVDGGAHPASHLSVAAWLEKIHTPPNELADVLERLTSPAGG